MLYKDLSIFNGSFWDLWIQKLLRNIASVKYQWLCFLYIPVVWGMFHLAPDGEPWISSALGLGFLGGGFITLATSRIIVRTKLREDDPGAIYKDKELAIKAREAKAEAKELKNNKKKSEIAEKKAASAVKKAEIAKAKAADARRRAALMKSPLDTDV